MKCFFKLVVFSLLFLSVPFIAKRDFRLPPIHCNFPANPNWEVPPPSAEILEVLQAPFEYYAKGNQSTVFLSKDGKYVLKLFRYRRSLFPFLHTLKNSYKKRPKLRFTDKLAKTFSATHLAATDGKEFTQVVFCHLNLTKDSLPTTRLKVGKKSFSLPLDKYRFALQRKAEPFKKTLMNAKNDPEEMRRLMNSFAQLLLNRSLKNISNSDPNLGPNFGFFEGRAVEIDFGNYQKIERDWDRQKEEVGQFLFSLESWAAKCAPEYFHEARELRIKTKNAYDALNEATQSIYRAERTISRDPPTPVDTSPSPLGPRDLHALWRKRSAQPPDCAALSDDP